MDNIDKIQNLFKNDWEKIPQNYRFAIIGGIILIFNSWLLDHWTSNGKPPFLFWWIIDFRVFGYSLGLTVILICFVLIFIKQLSNFGSLVAKYKKKYPIEKLDNTYFLIWFNGKLILFDKDKKKYYHIYPWTTAEDLQFVSYGKHVEDNFPDPKNPIIKINDNETLDTRKYLNGGSINTQK